LLLAVRVRIQRFGHAAEPQQAGGTLLQQKVIHLDESDDVFSFFRVAFQFACNAKSSWVVNPSAAPKLQDGAQQIMYPAV
jgi:hypothetical protein